ncbi:MAG: hypothetical protein ACKVOK_07550 [Flavobacteriales bacterium]
MSESTTNPGKGMGVAGFVLALVGIVGYFIVAGIAGLSAAATGGGVGLMIFWCVFCALALFLAFMGFKKSSAVGAKKGLATAGIVIAAVGLALSIWTTIGVNTIANDPSMNKLRDGIKDEFNKGMEKGLDDFKQKMDSLDDAH